MSQPQQIGKYSIVRRLGGGGMAEVFAARLMGAEGFARGVAIKRVLPGYAQDSAFAAMFIREAQLSAKFNHPNVVSVLDFDRDPDHGLFLAMEMVEGRDLSDLLQTGLLPFPVVVFLVSEILRGLGYAHNLPPDASGVQGVIHRDVSPHNVLVSWEGAVKVSDFGIAKARGAATSASASMMIKGKPAYMSPEQANGKPLDGHSDLFSVGVMLWEMLVGRPLFAGGTMHEMFAALFFSPIPSPRQERPEVPEDLAAITLRLLARQREQRYATAEDTIEALTHCSAASLSGQNELIQVLQERFAGQAPPRPSRAFAVAQGTPTPEPLQRDASSANKPQPARRRGHLVAAFLGAGALATALTLGAVRLFAEERKGNGPTVVERALPASPAAPAAPVAPAHTTQLADQAAPAAASAVLSYPPVPAPAAVSTTGTSAKTSTRGRRSAAASPVPAKSAAPRTSKTEPPVSEKIHQGEARSTSLEEAPNLLKGE